MTYEDAIREFEEISRRRALSDEYLRESMGEVRADLPVAIEFHYGITYLRDDAVELLIARIRELEKKCANTIKAPCNIQVTMKDIDDIMATALEEGICYWCEKVEVVGDYMGKYASDQISRGGELKLFAKDDNLNIFANGPCLLTKNKFLRGLKQYLDGCDELDSGKLTSAEAADCIIQYAVFGCLIYSPNGGFSVGMPLNVRAKH